MRYVALLAFFFSGMSSLILENLWVRMFTLVFGGSTLAIVTVLTVFMGGLALGSLLAGRIASRLKRPLFTYAVLEAAIAVYALIVPFLMQFLPSIYAWFPSDWSFYASAWVRFILCGLLLLIPTTFMGATLPILSQYFVRRRDTIGFDVAILYSINTFGAVAGAFMGGFVFLPLWGIKVSLWIIASALFAVALLIAFLDLRQPVEDEEAFFCSPVVEQEESISISQEINRNLFLSLDASQRRTRRAMFLIAITVTGFSAMVCQVIWSRGLAMVIGSSTYAFSLILGVFLIGLAGGAAYGARLVRNSMDLLLCWSRTLVATALFVAFSVLIFDRLPVLFLDLALLLPKELNPVLFFGLKAVVAGIPMFIPTFLMGTFFPIALVLYTYHQDDASIPVGQNVGRLYSINTLGSILGSALTGFLIIPWFGLQGGLAFAVILYLLSAWLLQWTTKGERRHHYTLVALVTSIAVLMMPTWNPGKLSLGMFRLARFREMSYSVAVTPHRTLFYKEGVSATVAVEGSGDHLALKVNGKAEASTQGDRPTQIAIAAFPLAMHHNPKDAVVIGWGSGMTIGAALHFPLKELVAVELEPAVVEGAKLFNRWNFQPLKDKRLRLIYNDGRNYLAMTPKRFDVIVSEPSNPWMSGVANLFTKEYFTLVKKRLKPDGIFCQWVQLYEISEKNIVSVLYSLQQVFPHLFLFEVGKNDTDTFLIASMKPLKLDLKTLQKKIDDPRLKKLFKYANIYDAHDLLPRFLLGQKGMKRLFKQIPPKLNTDSHNILEFTTPLDLVRAENDTSRWDKAIDKFGRNYKAYLTHKIPTNSLDKRVEFLEKSFFAYLRYNKVKIAKALLKKIVKLSPDYPQKKTYTRLVSLFGRKEKEPPLPKASHIKHVLARTAANEGPKKLGELRKKLRAYLRGHKAFEQRDYLKAIEIFEPLVKNSNFARDFPQICYYLGAAKLRKGFHPFAIKAFLHYIKLTSTRTHL